MIVFMVDPPWPKKKGGKRLVRPLQGCNLGYQTMNVPEIFELLDTEIFTVKENHAVFLWGVDEFLYEGEQAMFARGYKRHCRFIWDKLNGVAPAFTVRYSHEYLTWFYKPKLEPIAKEQRGKWRTVFTEASRQHSRKPEIAYQLIEALYPNAVKHDIFSREIRHSWVQFGDQLNHFHDVGE